MVCPAGYFGKVCNQMCPPGTFGPKCGGKCTPECTDEVCDHVKGCKRATKYIFSVTTSRTLITPKKQNSNESLFASQSTGKITSFIPQQSEPKDQININYLLAGVGGAISLFLLILLMQLCKKHKPFGRKVASQRMANEDDARDNSTNQAQNWNKKESYQILQGNQCVQCFDRMNPEYDEIDECLEKQNPLFQPCSCASKNDVTRLPTNSSNCKRSTKHKCSFMYNSDDYLHPM